MVPFRNRPEAEHRAAMLVVAHVFLVVGACAGSGYLRHGKPNEWAGLVGVTLGAAAWMWVHCARAVPALPPLRQVATGALLFFAFGQPFFLWRMVHHQSGVLVWAMRALSVAAAMLVLGYVVAAERRRWAGALFGTLILMAFLLRVLLLLDSPDPGTDPQRFLASWASDIYSFTNGGADRLLRGENPYTGSYPPWTADGRGMWNYYTYPPGFLLLSLPGRWLLGDVRWMHLLAIFFAAGCLYRMGRGVAEGERRLLVLLLLLHPRSLYLHEQAFTEPMVAAVALAMATAAVEKRWVATGALVGLAFMPTGTVLPLVGEVPLWLQIG
ncbi:MAG: hypothetical protein QHJ73_11665, partial [Armatimonadota bacterium]|nr:hypothetical protein [Armatimonadota bacterium]